MMLLFEPISSRLLSFGDLFNMWLALLMICYEDFVIYIQYNITYELTLLSNKVHQT